jgi:hypothetical protein
MSFDDGAAINFYYTSAEPDGEFVFTTLAQAKRRARAAAIPEREAWALCVRQIRTTTMDDVAPAWD